MSEFFFTNDTDDSGLVQRLQTYWQTSGGDSTGKMLLLTNQYPIHASIYAERRADSATEYELWKDHLQRNEIVSCSPGLLYVQQQDRPSSFFSLKVPKSAWGSIWTPSNPEAIQFTQHAAYQYFFGDEQDNGMQSS